MSTRTLTLLLLTCLSAPALMAQQTTDAEKALRADFEKAFKSKDAAERSSALIAYDEGTRALPDEGISRLVARTLAKGLEDDDASVARASVSALSWGRDPATVIEVMGEALENWRKVLEKTATRPDAESRDLYRATVDTYSAGSLALSNYKDDRSVKVLEDALRVLRPGGVLENISSNLLSPLASGLLNLGSERAVETVVKATATFPAATFGGTSDLERTRLGMSNALHLALAAFSQGLEVPPPEFSQNYQQDWADWFKQTKSRFPDKLGKLESPPGPAGEDWAMGRDAGRPERPS